MMNYDKSGPRSNYDKTEPRSYWPRAKTYSLCLGIISVAWILQGTNSITSVEDPVARECAAWANQAFDSPSPARDEAFIDCIVRQDPSAASDELRHKLESGDGDELFDRLMTGENLAISPETNCPFLRVAVRSPAGSNEFEQKPMRDLFSTALTEAGFNVVGANSMHHWWASSLTLDTGPNSAAWTILVRAVAEIGDGAIQFTTVRKTVDGREGAFSGMQSLRAFAKTEAPEAARLAAEGVARELLPAANRRCGDIDTAFDETRIALEQLRNELTEEIERVRRARNERERDRDGRSKDLEIEVEG